MERVSLLWPNRRYIYSFFLGVLVLCVGAGVKAQKSSPAPNKVADTPRVFLTFFKLNKKDKTRTLAITKILKKRKADLDRKKSKLSPTEKKEHVELTRDIRIWNAGYNVYKMTDVEKKLTAKLLAQKR